MPSSSITSRTALAMAILLTIAIAILILTDYHPRHPLRPGTPQRFFRAAANLNPDNSPHNDYYGIPLHHNHTWIYPYYHREAWYFYHISHAQLLADLPRVEAALKSIAASDPSSNPAEIYTRWKSLPAPHNTSLDALIDIHMQVHLDRNILTIESSSLELPTHRRIHFDHALIRQVARTADFYWLNALAEFLFLTALAWFALWPLIRRQSLARLLLHAFALVPLFYLPQSLGYAMHTSNFSGPLGGILYPQLLYHLGPPLFSFHWEFTLPEHYPLLLNFLNQAEYNDGLFPTYLPLHSFHAPSDILLRALPLPTFILLLTLSLRTLLRTLQKHPTPAFPITPNTSTPIPSEKTKQKLDK